MPSIAYPVNLSKRLLTTFVVCIVSFSVVGGLWIGSNKRNSQEYPQAYRFNWKTEDSRYFEGSFDNNQMFKVEYDATTGHLQWEANPRALFAIIWVEGEGCEGGGSATESLYDFRYANVGSKGWFGDTCAQPVGMSITQTAHDLKELTCFEECGLHVIEW